MIVWQSFISEYKIIKVVIIEKERAIKTYIGLYYYSLKTQT